MMAGSHQEKLFDKLRVLWFFIELNMLLFFMMSRHRRQQNPAPAQPEPLPQPQPRRRRRKPQNPWVTPWLLQREERGCYRTQLDELITTDIPGSRHFTRMEPTFFDLIEERITPTSGSQKQTSESIASVTETSSYIETFIHRRKLHFTAVPLEGWKDHHL